MPYVKRKYVKCIKCEDTNTLFHAKNKKLKDGSVVIRVSRVCKPCFLLIQGEYNSKITQEQKELYAAKKREVYKKNKNVLRERSLKYHHKNKEDQNRKRMIRYENSRIPKIATVQQKFVKKMQSRVSLGNRDNFYLQEKL